VTALARASFYSPDLRARRTALKIPHAIMAAGLGFSSGEIISIETAALADGDENERAEYYAYWIGRLERLTQEQRDTQVAHAREGKRFR
jgi:hypothetical protein